MDQVEIKAYCDDYRYQLLAVWEHSVLATHDFLKPSDFEEIKAMVATINFHDFEVFCLISGGMVLGFIGVADQKIEMLFLDPKYFGKGLGKKLLHFAVTALEANKLDVNEQNAKALGFYQKFGFDVFERTDKDDQGKDYPLLRMKLSNTIS